MTSFQNAARGQLHRRPGLFGAGMVAIITVAALLRLWSIDFGLPLVTHPDEPLIFQSADRMITDRSLNPHWFRYPALIIDTEAGVLTGVYAVDKVVGLDDDTIIRWGYTAGRLIMALLGVGTVLIAGLAARRIIRLVASGAPGRPADAGGLVSAGMLAVSFIHVKDSHYLKPDVPTGFFTALTLWFTLNAIESDRPEQLRRWLPAGIAAGLAAAAKYNGALVALVPALALLLLLGVGRRQTRQAVPWRRIAILLGAMGLAAVAAFLLLNPYVLLSPDEFLNSADSIRAEITHYRTGHDGAEGDDTWLWYPAELWRNGFGPLLTPLAVLGGVLAVGCLGKELFFLLRRGRHSTGAPAEIDAVNIETVATLLPVLVFITGYYLLIAPHPVRFDRQLIPILPYLAVLGGFGVGLSLAVLHRRRALQARIIVPAVLGLALLLALPVGMHGLDWSIDAGKQDSRYTALAWIEANIPPGARIAREWHTPPLAGTGYDEVEIRSLNDQPAAWYEAVGADYLVLSSFMYQRYLDDPERYPNEAAFYEGLLARPRLATFGSVNGPDIVVVRWESAAPAFGAEAPETGRRIQPPGGGAFLP